MTRYPHFLAQIKGERQPSSIVCLATESHDIRTDQSGHSLSGVLDGWQYIWRRRNDKGYVSTAAVGGNTSGLFWSFMSGITRHGGCTWLFIDGASRALALLDFWALLENKDIRLTGADPWEQSSSGSHGERKQSSYCVIEDPPVVILCRLAGMAGTLKIVDVRNYTLSPLSIQGTLTEQACGVLAFVEAMIDTLTVRKLGSIQATAASQALTSFKHKHLEAPIYVHTDALALSVERKAMFGGRNECARIAMHKGITHCLDFRSSYPSLLQSERLPTMLFCSSINPGAWDARSLQDGRQCIADVTVRTDVPCVPYRLHYDTVFPVGRFRTTLCTPELLLMLKHGQIDCWHSAAWYDSSVALSSFANDWISLRYSSQYKDVAGFTDWTKAVANSLHGKFGQRSQCWVDEPDYAWSKPYDTWYRSDDNGTHTRYRSIAWNVQHRDDMGEHSESCPAIAAWVCSLGRAKLFSAIMELEPCEFLYCDTDSLFVTDSGLMSLTDAGIVGTGEPGKLRLVNTFKWIDIKGLKWYETEDGVTCAGKPRSTPLSFGGKVGYLYNLGISEAVKCGSVPSAAARFVPFQRQGSYSHGIVQPDGMVKPLEIWQ